MKRKYCKPLSMAFLLDLEEPVLSSSLPMNDDIKEGGDARSNKRGWDSSEWCDEE